MKLSIFYIKCLFFRELFRDNTNFEPNVDLNDIFNLKSADHVELWKQRYALIFLLIKYYSNPFANFTRRLT